MSMAMWYAKAYILKILDIKVPIPHCYQMYQKVVMWCMREIKESQHQWHLITKTYPQILTHLENGVLML